MSDSTRDPTPPGKGAIRSGLAGLTVLVSGAVAARYGPEAGAAAGELTELVLIPVLGGALLGLGTFLRKRRADLSRIL